MILWLNILIDFCLVFAIEVLRRRRPTKVIVDKRRVFHRVEMQKGLMEQVQRKAAVAEKMANRAFNMASSANLGVIALQKSLAIPRVLTKAVGQKNALAKNEVDKLFTQSGKFDFLMPILDDDERQIIEDMQNHAEKEEP